MHLQHNVHTQVSCAVIGVVVHTDAACPHHDDASQVLYAHFHCDVHPEGAAAVVSRRIHALPILAILML